MKSSQVQKHTLLLLFTLVASLLLAASSFIQKTIASTLTSFTGSVYLPLVLKATGYNWLQFNGDPSHRGNDSFETVISPATVGNLTLLFQVNMLGVADGAPVYLSEVNTPLGLRDMVYVTTKDGKILAIDAHIGSLVWSKQYGPAGCLINNNLGRNQACYTTSSPVIDPGLQFVYSYGLDGYVHKFAVGSGSEVTSGGWPELATLKRYDEKGSSALSLASATDGNSYLYVAQAGYPGDQGNYQGHITAINISDGSQKVFNALCSNQPVHFVDSRATSGPDCLPNTTSAIWSRPGVVYDPYHDRILMATGNGTFTPGSYMWGDSIFSLNPDGSTLSGIPLDSYTPSNYQSLQDTDLDLGSTAPAILPVAQGKYPHLAVQGGKDSVLRLINLDNMSGQNAPGHTGGEVFLIPLPMGGMLLTQPAVWINPSDHSTWVFVSNDRGSAALQLSIGPAGDPSLIKKWGSSGGSSPLVVNGLVFISSSGSISAYNALDGTLLWTDNRIGSIHWESPIVDNGVVYITDESGNLTAYTLP